MISQNESENSSLSEELAPKIETLCVEDRSYVLSPTSTTSSSGEVEMTSAFEIQRYKLNAFLGECETHPLEKPWLEWANVGDRAHPDTFKGQIVGISKLNNFRFTGGKLTAWRAYAVGRGKLLELTTTPDL